MAFWVPLERENGGTASLPSAGGGASSRIEPAVVASICLQAHGSAAGPDAQLRLNSQGRYDLLKKIAFAMGSEPILPG